MFLTWGHGDRGGEVSAFMIATESEGCTGWTGTRRIWQGREERTRDPLVLVARGSSWVVGTMVPDQHDTYHHDKVGPCRLMSFWDRLRRGARFHSPYKGTLLPSLAGVRAASPSYLQVASLGACNWPYLSRNGPYSFSIINRKTVSPLRLSMARPCASNEVVLMLPL